MSAHQKTSKSRKPPLMQIVLTGRDTLPEIIECAYGHRMNDIRNACQQGIEPQKGIDN
jgi:ATP:corrinoid adenosyltransferase